MYFATASGRKIEINNLSEDDVSLDDISHHLSRICRYGGAMALDKHYSVASHSIYLAQYALDNNMGAALARALLMHDASEAYLGDIVSGLKPFLPDYLRIERDVQNIIADKYGIPIYTTAKTVKELDTRIVLDEAAAFMPHFYHLYAEQLGYEPLDINIQADGSLFTTKQRFLGMCRLLGVSDEN